MRAAEGFVWNLRSLFQGSGTAPLTTKVSQYLCLQQIQGEKITYWGSNNNFLTEQYQNRSIFNICLCISLIL